MFQNLCIIHWNIFDDICPNTRKTQNRHSSLPGRKPNSVVKKADFIHVNMVRILSIDRYIFLRKCGYKTDKTRLYTLNIVVHQAQQLGKSNRQQVAGK